MRRIAPAIAVAASICAGCDDADQDRRARPPAEPPVAADRSLQRPPPLGTGVVLRGRYPFMGRPRRVDSTITVSRVGGGSGGKALRLTVRIEDRGRSRFPFQWARFVLVDRKGERLADPVQSPLRSLAPGKARAPRAATLTFDMRRGSRPVAVRLSSIVKVWPFAARWRLSGPTG